jgi:hypothetical protein
MRPDLHRHFLVLGLSPGASSNDIRVAYRRRIQEWHPDRFAAGSLMQTTAEDHTKELNEAYECLYKKRLYRKFLRTEANPRQPERPAAAAAEAAAAGPPGDPAETAEAEAPAPARRTRPWAAFLRPRRVGRRIATGLGFAAVALLATFLLRPHRITRGASAAQAPVLPSPSADVPSQPAAPVAAPLVSAPPAPEPAPASPAARDSSPPPSAVAVLSPLVLAPSAAPEIAAGRPAGARAEPAFGAGPAALERPPGRDHERAAASFETDLPQAQPAGEALAGARLDQSLDAAETDLDTFDVGDSPAWVKIIQGTPDETVAGAFRYGSSLITFEKGRVSGWIDGVPRLRVPSLTFVDFQDEMDAFSVGSTRGEVFQIQGKPDRVSGDAYVYGTDVVYFGNDRVVDWIRTDGRLRTRVLPDLPFFDPRHPR